MIRSALTRATPGGALRRAAIVIVALVTLAYVAAAPVLTGIGNQLARADPLERADAMIILAPSLDRVVEGAELYRGGYAPIVVMTREQREPAEQLLIERGVLDSGEERRRHVLRAEGVPSDAIVILDEFVSSTADEARAFARWASTRSLRRVLVVTSAFHTGRSRLTFTRALAPHGTKVLVRPSRLGREFPPDAWWRSRNTLRDGAFEWQKLVYYHLFEVRRLGG